MLCFVLKPAKAPVVNGENLYDVRVNGEPLFRVRAKNAGLGERKVMVCFRHELTGRTLNFNLGDFPEYDKENDNEGKRTLPGDGQLQEAVPEGGCGLPVLQAPQE